ncbi:MAG: hypothetical protein ICV83_00120 [Cytophagales bacterium]|nr:hypothetical protein [Cytophagales bacterium]
MQPRLLLLLFGLCLLPAATAAQKKVRILFIGNSYTTYDGYNIPRKLNRMASAAGKKVLIRQHTRNGLPLREHLANRRARAKINRRPWDYVVLQEQSWTAVANPQEGMYPAARALDSLIRQRGSRTVFYLLMPKAYSADAVFTVTGDSTVYYYAVFRDFGHASDSLRHIHLKIARELGAVVAPVGPAFALALAGPTDLKLYRKDRVHPTREGAYLVACVFYASLFGESPADSGYRARVAPELARYFQAVATRTVLEQKHRWQEQQGTRRVTD